MQAPRSGVLALALGIGLVSLPAAAGDGPNLVRLTSGQQLLARPTGDPFLWETAFGLLEIVPERLSAVSGADWRTTGAVANTHRFRLADGALHAGRALRVDGQRLVLAPGGGGGEVALALDEVLEVDDLPRSGPGGSVPLLPLTAGPTRRERPPGSDPPPMTPPRAHGRAEAAAPTPEAPPEARRRRRISGGARVGQFFLGGAGMLGGVLVGALVGAAGSSSGDELGPVLAGTLVGGTLASAATIYGVGSSNGGEGSFLGTLAGSAVGTVAGVLAANASDFHGGVIFLSLSFPLVGGITGYAASEP